MKDVSLILHYLDPASVRGTLLLTEDVDRISPLADSRCQWEQKNQGCNIYENIFSLGETCIAKHPLNTTFQWRMPCNATLKGKRRQYDKIHTFWVLDKFSNIQYTNYRMCKSYVRAKHMKIYLA